MCVIMRRMAYVTEHHSRSAHIERGRESTSLIVSGDQIIITQRIQPAGWSGEGARYEMTLQAAELVEALRLLGLVK